MSNTELLRKVREVIASNPERHMQRIWFASRFGTSLMEGVPVDEAREWALKPIPETQMERTGVCGTVGCVAGWGAILSAPAGSKLTSNGVEIVFPGGMRHNVDVMATEAMGLSSGQAGHLFGAMLSTEAVLAELDYLIEHPDDERSYLERYYANEVPA